MLNTTFLSEAQLKSLSGLLAGNNTHKEIDAFLVQAGIKNEGVPSKTIGGGLGYVTGTNKADKLYNSFAAEHNKSQSQAKIYNYIERVAAPALYIGQVDTHKSLIESISKILLFSGLSLN